MMNVNPLPPGGIVENLHEHLQGQVRRQAFDTVRRILAAIDREIEAGRITTVEQVREFLKAASADF